MRIILAILIAATAMLVCALDGRAHGDAEWIMRDPGYTDRSGIHCCGPSDCSVVPDGEISETQETISHKGDAISKRERGSYWSIDNRYWVCRRFDGVKCIFRPQPGS